MNPKKRKIGTQGKAPNYSMENDLTLTEKQRKQKSFQPSVVENTIKRRSGSRFRYPSNPTKKGHSTGYHESWGTTDTIETLARRKVSQKAQTSTLPSNARGVFKGHKGSIREELIPIAIGFSDTLRTDTAQTVLSAPHGKAGGHSGSNVRTTGQAPAHNKLRRSFMDTVTDPDVDSDALELIGSAVTIASMAPAKVARTAQNSNKLKAGREAKEEYERKRNDAKRRLNMLRESASPKSIKTAEKHVDSFLSDLPGRSRQTGALSSPIRVENTGPTGDILGGDYVPIKKQKRELSAQPKILPPVQNKKKGRSTSQTGAYITQPFREKRR